MKVILKRTSFDKLSAITILLALFLFGYYTFPHMDVLELVLLITGITIFFINAAFIVLTPIARLHGNKLTLYQESQPTVFNFKPQFFDITEINEIEIRRRLFEFRVIFKLRHGTKIYHSFPATREKRIKYFFDFLSKNTKSEIIKSAYEKSLKSKVVESDTL